LGDHCSHKISSRIDGRRYDDIAEIRKVSNYAASEQAGVLTIKGEVPSSSDLSALARIAPTRARSASAPHTARRTRTRHSAE
jgi:hypothetical protein